MSKIFLISPHFKELDGKCFTDTNCTREDDFLENVQSKAKELSLKNGRSYIVAFDDNGESFLEVYNYGDVISLEDYILETESGVLVYPQCSDDIALAFNYVLDHPSYINNFLEHKEDYKELLREKVKNQYKLESIYKNR